jgi:hypothetical protein
MARRIALIDEAPTKQERQCESVGADVELDSEFDETDIEWGSDPFDILAHKEEAAAH